MNNEMEKVFHAAKRLQYKGPEKYATVSFILSKLEAWGDPTQQQIEEMSKLFHDFPCVLRCGWLDPLREMFPTNKLRSGTDCILLFFEHGPAGRFPGRDRYFDINDMEALQVSAYKAIRGYGLVRPYLTLSKKVKRDRVYWIALAKEGE